MPTGNHCAQNPAQLSQNPPGRDQRRTNISAAYVAPQLHKGGTYAAVKAALCQHGLPIIRANRERLWEDFAAVAKIGRRRDGGISREAYSPAFMEARRFVQERMVAAGLKARVDAAGNLFGRTLGAAPVVLTGSHLDAVPNGGAFDGAVGVICALEATRAISETSVSLENAIEVVAFAEEEGRFTGLLGSALMVGAASISELPSLKDVGGDSLSEVLSSVGLNVSRLGDARRAPAEIAAFVELHIEQGAVLENLGLPIGVVTNVSATYRLAVELHGRADHAGATPLDHRKDALLAAAEVITQVRSLAVKTGRPSIRATVGQLVVSPNVTSVVAESVRFVVDVRDTEEEPRSGLIEQIRAAIDLACSREGLAADMRATMSARPIRTDARVVDAIESACRCFNLPFAHIVSGASHDALNVALVAPTGMIFVRSVGGRSHTPTEFTSGEDIAAGADALIGTLIHLRLAAEPASGRSQLA